MTGAYGLGVNTALQKLESIERELEENYIKFKEDKNNKRVDGIEKRSESHRKNLNNKVASLSSLIKNFKGTGRNA
jgi:hypothetical protein